MPRGARTFAARVSKFDPALRDANGVFFGDDWTSFADIGKPFDGVLLTLAAYERVESAYVDTLVAMLAETGIRMLRVEGLEQARANGRDRVRAGEQLSLRELPGVLRRVLRDELWCRFENDRAHVHVGWDFLTYVGLPREPRDALRLAADRGLFVERMASPHG